MNIPTRIIYLDRAEESRLKSYGPDEFVRATLIADHAEHNVKIRYRGGHTRYYPKKSYELRIGNRSIHYNAELDDPTMMRNALSFAFFEQLGVPSPRTRHVKLRINGVDRGLYLEIEGVDRSFFSKRRVKANSLLYAVNNNANFRLENEYKKKKRSLSSGYELVIGGAKEFRDIGLFVRKVQTLKRSGRLAYLKSRLHIPQYLRWLAGAVFTGNYDGFDQNYALYRTAGSVKYHISPWDYEGTWGRDCYGGIVSSGTLRIEGYNGLTEKLLSYPSIRESYRKTLQSIMKKQFTIEALEPKIRMLHAKLLPELVNDRTRRHSPYEIRSDLNVFLRYIPERRAFISKELSKL